MTTGPHSSGQPGFLKNANSAAREVFIPWFLDNKGGSFEQMLRSMHRVSATGLPAQREEFTGLDNYSSADVFPGMSRVEVLEMDEAGINAFGGREKFEAAVAHLRGNQMWTPMVVNRELYMRKFKTLSELKKEGTVVEDKYRIVIPQRGRSIAILADFQTEGDLVKRVQWDVVPPGLSPEGKIQNVWQRVDDARVVENYSYFPDERQLPSFIREAERLMNEIKALPVLPNGSGSHSRLLVLLADYFQVMLTSHFFCRINFSLLMNQVNTILYLNNMNPVYHEDLDRWAIVLPPEQFREVFVDQVRAFNP